MSKSCGNYKILSCLGCSCSSHIKQEYYKPFKISPKCYCRSINFQFITEIHQNTFTGTQYKQRGKYSNIIVKIIQNVFCALKLSHVQQFVATLLSPDTIHQLKFMKYWEYNARTVSQQVIQWRHRPFFLSLLFCLHLLVKSMLYKVHLNHLSGFLIFQLQQLSLVRSMICKH